MIILAIETSCDDTCLSIIKINKKGKAKISVLSNLISSQVKIHKKYGGVYPALARREHQKNLPLLFEKAKKEAKLKKGETIDLVAVTIGPGLSPCLWVGVNFAKDVSQKLDIPILPINHIEGHIIASWFLPQKLRSSLPLPKFKAKMFPAICLVVSGGHTQLVLMKKLGQYKILGETRDDAAGECFDKIGRMLGLDYPGGPAIEAETIKAKAKKLKLKIDFPRPMIHQKNYDFSFSGLKTAALYNYKDKKPKVRKSKEYIQAVCVETQQAIVDVLINKTIRAAKDYKAKTIILGGGVTANKELRKQFKVKVKKELPNVQYNIPGVEYCTDNALMIAITAYCYKDKAKKDWKKFEVDANLSIENEIRKA